MAAVDRDPSSLPPAVAEPVVDRLRAIAEAIDGPPSAEIDSLIASLFSELQTVANAVGVLPGRRHLAGH